MKKLILLLLVIGFHQSVFAKVLKVKEYGVDGSYPSISMAVAASSINDTIIIYPKKFGSPFLEDNLIVPHQIFFFNSDSSKFIFHFPLELNNCDVSNTIFNYYVVIKNSSLTNCEFKEEIDIFNSKLFSCVALKRVNNNTTKSNIELMGSQINEFIPNNGFVNLRLIGNLIGKIVDLNFIGDTIEILGNSINYLNNDYVGFNFKPSKFGLMSGNVFNLTFNRGWGCNYSNFNWSNNGNFYVTNNFFNIFNRSNYNQPCQESLFYNYGNDVILNNVIYYKDNGQFTYFSKSSFLNNNSGINKGNLLITNRSNYSTWWDTVGWYKNENKFIGGISNISLDSNGIFVDSNTINKGVLIPQFMDLDLTTPDIGPYGGPFPITNYLNLDAQKSKILYVQLPQKVISPSGPIPIKAVGTAK
jgi:hypothetical protein